MIELISLHIKGFKRLDLAEPINFPRDPLLIYGLNESGKSTVMEAIHFGLFGMPLRPSRKAGVEDYLNYGMDTGFVHLVFKIGDIEYWVKRTIKRKGTNIHELDVKYPDGKTESITNARKVNDKIIEDLHGINSDALLNSCMVEQKALGKLESSNKQERINAITLLLNLEAFTAAQGELKSIKKTKVDSLGKAETELEKWKGKKEKFEESLAKKEGAEKKLREAEEELPNVIKLIDELKVKLDAISKAKGLEGDVRSLKEREEGLVKKVEELKKSLEEVKEAKRLLEKSKKKLPQLSSKFKDAEKRVEALESLIKMDSERREISGKINNLQTRNDAAVEDVEESRKASEKAELLKKEYESQIGVREAERIAEETGSLVSEITKAKRDAEREGAEIQKLEEKLESLKNVEDKITVADAKIRELESKKDVAIRNRTFGYGVGGGGLVVGLALGAMITPAMFVLSVLSLVIGGYLVTKNDVGEIASELGNKKAELSAMLGDKSNIKEYKERLDEKNTLVKQAKDRSKDHTGLLIEVIGKLPEKPRLYKDIFDLKNVEGSQRALEKAIQGDREKLKKLETDIAHVSESASLLGKREKNLKELQEQMEGRKGDLGQLEFKIKTLEKESRVALEKEKRIRKEKEDLGNEVSRLGQEIKGLEETVAKEKKFREGLTGAESDLEGTRKCIKENQEEIEGILAEHGVTIKMEEEFTNEREKRVKRKGELENSIGGSQDVIKEAKEIIDENKEAPEKYDETKDLMDSLVFEVTSLDRAVKIINTTRDGIVAGVKDRIEAHMAKFLPLLTAGRYSVAKIDESEYKVEVYDREARRWRMKGVFSGATQDQFSLALRLAFALSTLPTSRGVVPGFIFLDEPLSGFDDERRKGLVQLLTKGDIATQFEQIVVISHGSQLREEFPSRLHMERGRVVEKV